MVKKNRVRVAFRVRKLIRVRGMHSSGDLFFHYFTKKNHVIDGLIAPNPDL